MCSAALLKGPRTWELSMDLQLCDKTITFEPHHDKTNQAVQICEPHYEKTNVLHMRKQRHRSAS